MKQSSTEIAQLAKRLLTEVTRSAAVFPVKMRRTLGDALREDALQILLRCQEAYRLSKSLARQLPLIEQLSDGN